MKFWVTLIIYASLTVLYSQGIYLDRNQSGLGLSFYSLKTDGIITRSAVIGYCFNRKLDLTVGGGSFKLPESDDDEGNYDKVSVLSTVISIYPKRQNKSDNFVSTISFSYSDNRYSSRVRKKKIISGYSYTMSVLYKNSSGGNETNFMIGPSLSTGYFHQIDKPQIAFDIALNFSIILPLAENGIFIDFTTGQIYSPAYEKLGAYLGFGCGFVLKM